MQLPVARTFIPSFDTLSIARVITAFSRLNIA